MYLGLALMIELRHRDCNHASFGTRKNKQWKSGELAKGQVAVRNTTAGTSRGSAFTLMEVSA